MEQNNNHEKFDPVYQRKKNFVCKLFWIDPADSNIDIKKMIDSYEHMIDIIDNPAFVFDESKIIFTSKELKKHIWENIKDILSISHVSQLEPTKWRTIKDPDDNVMWWLQIIDQKYKRMIVNESVAEISQKILSYDMDIKEISDIILNSIKKITNSEMWCVWHFDDSWSFVLESFTENVSKECKIKPSSKNEKIIIHNSFWLFWWSREHKQSFFTNDYEKDFRSTGIPQWHVKINNFLTVPALIGNDTKNPKVVWQISLANSPREFTNQDIEDIKKFAFVYAIAIQKYEKQLKEEKQKRFQKIISDISQSFIYIETHEDFDRTINASLDIIREFFDADRSYIFEFSQDMEYMSNTYEAVNSEKWVSPEIDNIQDEPFDIYNWLFNKIIENEPVQLTDIEKIKSTSPNEYKEFKRQWIKSLACFPLSKWEKVFWFIWVDMVEEQKTLDEEDISLFRILSQTISNVFQKRDVEKKLETAKEQAEAANIAKSRFIANMSHEIRTPLNWLLWSMDMLLNSELSDEEREIFKKALFDSQDRLLNLINNILEISKIESGIVELDLKRFNLEECLNSVFTTQKNSLKKDIEFNLDMDKELKWLEVFSDPDKLAQVLNNLLSNAVKFTERGKVSLNVKKISEEWDRLILKISVKDTWIWMNQDDLKNIFEEFVQVDSSYTKKYQWTGLWLAITKKLLEMMWWEISVDSQEDKWTTFHFTLPLEKTQDRVTKTNLKQIQSKNANMEKWVEYYKQFRIMLVEDDKTSQFLAKKILSERWYSVETYDDGRQAVENFEKWRFDTILMDIQMPVVDWIQATKKIKQIDPSIPIIALSAYSMKEDIDHILSCWLDEFVSKPISPKNVYDMLDKFLEEK